MSPPYATIIQTTNKGDNNGPRYVSQRPQKYFKS